MTTAEIIVAMDDELLSQAEYVAGELQLTKSEFIEEAIRRELQRYPDLVAAASEHERPEVILE